MKVRYIAQGVKTDSIRGVGLRWEPGQVRTVSPEMAERLLFFTDTWVKDESKGDDTQPIGLTADEKAAEEPMPVVDFHAMDKQAMLDYASREFNIKMDKRISEENIRHKIIGLFTQHHMDEESK